MSSSHIQTSSSLLPTLGTGLVASLGVQVPGDLDPKVSPHYLTTMKKAYLKLRYLVDSGCIFVGHDLRHDFKSINIIVPPQQVINCLLVIAVIVPFQKGAPMPGSSLNSAICFHHCILYCCLMCSCCIC